MKKLQLPDKEIFGSLTNKNQELIIFPTEKCNFRCTYCYEDFSIGRMSKDIVKGIKALMAKRAPELDNLYLSWFGGEPLVAKDIVVDISKYAYELSREYNFGYVGEITTNGYSLTPKVFSQLTEVNVLKYQISLDGPKEIHNMTRLRADGKGTFERIWENLLSIRDSNKPVSITIRVHLDNEKLNYIDSLIADIRKEFIFDRRFSVFFKPIEKLGGKNDDKLDMLNTNKRKDVIAELQKKLYGKTILKEDGANICYAAKPNSLIIRSDGKINKCTVALNDSRNHIGTLSADGTLKINHQLLSPWLRGFSTLDLDALSCPLQTLSVSNN